MSTCLHLSRLLPPRKGSLALLADRSRQRLPTFFQPFAASPFRSGCRQAGPGPVRKGRHCALAGHAV